MKSKILSIPLFVLALAFASIFAVAGAQGQPAPASMNAPAPGTSLAPNQTLGFGNDQLLRFTYTMNYDCVDQPKYDLNYNKKPMESDPGEYQTPICQAATQPTLSPPGRSAANVLKLYVMIPMFSTNNDQNPNDAIACPPGARPATLCGSALGKTLIKLFGAIPEAYEEHPSVYTDCPAPGETPGTCVTHADTFDIGKVLVALHLLPAPAKNVFTPLPNHSHLIVHALNTKPIWWEVVPVLVTNPDDFPTADGSRGITSGAKLKAAEAGGNAIAVPSNFFLFFGSQAVVPKPPTSSFADTSLNTKVKKKETLHMTCNPGTYALAGWTLNFGDGSQTTGTLSGHSIANFTAEHAWTKGGHYTATLVCNDARGNSSAPADLPVTATYRSSGSGAFGWGGLVVLLAIAAAVAEWRRRQVRVRRD